MLYRLIEADEIEGVAHVREFYNRLFYAAAAYVPHHALRTDVLARTELAAAQPRTMMIKLFKIAVRVVSYKDRIRLRLPSDCPVASLL